MLSCLLLATLWSPVNLMRLVLLIMLFFNWPFHDGISFVDRFLLFMFHVCLCYMLYCLLLAALWSPAEKGLTSWISCVFLCVMVSCVFDTFRYGFLGQVWYLIVSIPDLCLLYIKCSSALTFVEIDSWTMVARKILYQDMVHNLKHIMSMYNYSVLFNVVKSWCYIHTFLYTERNF